MYSTTQHCCCIESGSNLKYNTLLLLHRNGLECTVQHSTAAVQNRARIFNPTAAADVAEVLAVPDIKFDADENFGQIEDRKDGATEVDRAGQLTRCSNNDSY